LVLEPAVAHCSELLEGLHHTQELLPVGAAERLELSPPQAQALGDGLELAPLAVAPGGGTPGAAMAFDRRQSRLRTLRALPVDQLGDRQALELGGRVAQPPPVTAAAIAPVALVVVAFAAALAPVLPAVARHVQGRRSPEDALDDAALHAHGGAVRQERVDE